MGSLRVWSTPDGFVEVNYFSSEQDARAAEQQDPPAEFPEAFGDYMTMMQDAEYFDFTEPFLHSPAGRAEPPDVGARSVEVTAADRCVRQR